MALRMTLKKGLACLATLFLITTPVLAQTIPQTKPLSIDYAIEMGINMDTKLPEYSRKVQLYDALKGDYDNIAAYQYQQYNIYIDQYETSKIYRKDVIAKNVLESYQNIILLQEKINLCTSQIALEEKVSKQYAIKLKNGMCDQLAYDKQIQALQDLKDQKEKYEKTLTNSKAAFLKLTNLNLDNYTYEPDYTYEEFNLNATANSYASGMATELIKYQKSLAELSDSHFWDTIYNAGPNGTGPNYSTYVQQKINVADALAIVDSNYTLYRSAIESQYTTASTNLNDISIAKAAYEQAQTDLKPLEIKYRSGYISSLDYEQQLVNTATKKVEYLSAIYTYNINKFELEHPWSMEIFSY